MATRKQKEKLITALKFVPHEIEITLAGYGGEIVLGTITKEQYQYWSERSDELTEFCGWGSEEGIPEEMAMFDPGSWYDCDNLAHDNGVEMSHLCGLEIVEVDSKKTLLNTSLDIDELATHGIEAEEMSVVDLDDLTTPTYVFGGQSVEKGVFFSGQILLEKPLDLSLLKIEYVTVNGWSLVTDVVYDGQSVDGHGAYSTSGKSSDFWVGEF